jgi:CRP-like cAMP-binding protein
MTEKSILEQALLQVQNLEEAVKQNAKGILASTMKEELKDLLKESLEEEEKVEDETEVSEQPTSDEEDTDDMSDDDAEADDAEADDAENMDDLDNEPSKDIESLDSEVGGDEMGDEESMDSEDSLELPSDDMGMDDEDVMDMTGASDEEVLKVFKAMKPEDGIVVKKDGNNVEFETADDEYIIKLDGEEESEVEDEFGMEEEMMPSEEESETEEETIYEIEMEEEEMEEEKEVEATEGESKEEKPKEVEATEAARTFANDVRVPANQGKKFKAGRHEMNEEVENLKKQNAEYKKALILFKEKLNEVAVFNANLAYATRLFTEHSTTKQEKLNILKRFDSVSTMNESKNLFSTIKSELGTKTTVTETVAEKISNTPTTSSSTEVLSESKAYENPQFSRIKEMMKKIK